MRTVTFALGLVLVAGCAKEKPAPPPPATPPPAPLTINLADVAGNWTVKVLADSSDSVVTTYTMHATAADTGWTITFTGRKPMAMQVSTSGDSIMATVPEFESVLRKHTKVSTEGVMHLVNGNLVGTTVAHYKTTKADSVAHLRLEGTKKP